MNCSKSWSVSPGSGFVKDQDQDQDQDQQEGSSWTVLCGHSHRCFVTFSPIWRVKIIIKYKCHNAKYYTKGFHLFRRFLTLVLVTLLTLLVRNISTLGNLSKYISFKACDTDDLPGHICTSCAAPFCTVCQFYNPPGDHNHHDNRNVHVGDYDWQWWWWQWWWWLTWHSSV